MIIHTIQSAFAHQDYFDRIYTMKIIKYMKEQIQ